MNDRATRPPLKRRMIWMLILMGLLVAGLVGFGRFKMAMLHKFLASAAKPPQSVTSTQAVSTPWQPDFETVGALRAAHGVDLSVESAGIVRTVLFHNGDRIKAGQPLLELVDDAEQAAARTLEASVELARVTLSRDQAQWAIKAISQAQLDVDRADLAGKEAQLAQQRALLAKKTLRAPFAGRIGITTVNPGQYLNPGDKVTSLQSLDDLLIDFSVPQQYLAHLALGQPVTLQFEGWPGKDVKASVVAFNPQVDAATRNLMIEARLQPTRLALLPGLFGKVRWVYGQAVPQVTIPQSALIFNPYGSTVFTLKRTAGGANPTANQTFVTVGDTRGDRVAILSGIAAGDEVVTSGQIKLKTGSPVIVSPEAGPPANDHPTPQE